MSKITQSQYRQVPSALRWLVDWAIRQGYLVVIPDPVAAPPSPPAPAPTPAPTPAPENPATGQSEALVDAYTPTAAWHGKRVMGCRVACRMWNARNEHGFLYWEDDRKPLGWPVKTASNGKQLQGVIWIAVIRYDREVSNRVFDKIGPQQPPTGKTYEGIFRDPSAQDEGNPFRDFGNRPRSGDTIATCVMNEDVKQRSTICLFTWK